MIDTETSFNSFNVLKRLDFCRSNPDVFIGNVENAFFHMFHEVFYNCIMEYSEGDCGCSEVIITFFKDGFVSFQSNGSSFLDTDGLSFFSRFPEKGIFSPDSDQCLYFFEDSYSVVNAFSSHFEVRGYHEGIESFAIFKKGRLFEGIKKVGPTKLKGSLIKFKPDGSIIPQKALDLSKCLELIRLNAERGLKIQVIDERTNFRETIYRPKEPSSIRNKINEIMQVLFVIIVVIVMLFLYVLIHVVLEKLGFKRT